ncbi:hypothetical protein FT663_04375 [Candidozyma haemuli var. vulneris]|nr:hypothetical protein FT663_04375 [[Candida] haemuloni var. vulneris]KAF3992619.1 hypothetical protein FT662_01000 [[Candida] haemuloni var. vulneris]
MFWVNVSLFVAAAFFLWPRGKSPVYTKTAMSLLLTCLIALFVTMTPEKALQSAPFHRYSVADIAYSSCSIHVRTLNFCDLEDVFTPENELCLCENINALATVSHCYLTAYPHLVDTYIQRCNEKMNVPLTREQFDNAHLLYEEEAQNESTIDKETSTQATLNHPVKLDDALIFRYRDSYDQFLGNYNRSIGYGFYLVAFWAVVFTLVGLANWSKIWFPRLNERANTPTINWIRKKITLPATFGRYKTNEKRFLKVLDFLSPTRLETVTLVAFTAMTVYFFLANIKYVEGDPIFKTKDRALARYYAVRSGVLASYLFPFSILFAGRNNILQWLTRWEYAAFVTLHRWISRIMMVLLIIHANGYAYIIRDKPDFHLTAYLIWGAAAYTSGIVILVQGLLVLRRKWYETFLLLHIVLALVFAIGAWFHVDDLYFLWYYYFSAWLWATDRIIRIQRLAYFGFPLADVKLYEDETLKVTVPLPKNFKAEGGGHCFVHFLRPYCFWQSHPFTYTLVGNNIIFYAKVKKGVTRDLATYLENNPDKSAKIRVAVEGSYGEATPAYKHDTSVFLAGGNGIPGILAEAVEVIERQDTFSKRTVKLIWVVREYQSILWFFDELASLKQFPIETEIYVTRPSAMLTSPHDKSPLLSNTYAHFSAVHQFKDPIGKLKEDLKHIRFHEGRPNVPKIVQENVECSSGSCCFVTCGHPIMVDDLRHEVVQVIDSEKVRVDYYEQLQVWS